MQNTSKIKNSWRMWTLGVVAFCAANLLAFKKTPELPWDPFASFLTQSESPAVAHAPLALTSEENRVAQEILRRTTSLSLVQAIRTAQVICEESKNLGYDPLLFLAIIHVESSFDHLAVSSKGAQGLMQIMPQTARWVAARYEEINSDALDPLNNVRLGIRYVAYLHRHFHKMDNALVAYHRGPEAVRILLEENEGILPQDIYDDYASKVLGHYRYLKKHSVKNYQSLPI